MYPFAQKTFSEHAESWRSILFRGECGSVLNLSKRDQVYRITQFIGEQSNVKEVFLALDFDSVPVESPHEAKQYIDTILGKQRNKAVMFLVYNADSLFQEKQTILSYLNSLHFDQGYSFLYFFKRDVTAPEIYKQIGNLTTIYQNIDLYPHYSTKDVDNFIEFCEKDLTVPLSLNFKQQLHTQCGGILWLVREAIRTIEKTKQESGVFDSVGIKLRVEILFSEFTEIEQKVLKKVVLMENAFTWEEKHALEYLLSVNILDRSRLKYHIKSGLLEAYIRKIQSQSLDFVIKGMEIHINNICISSFLTSKENAIFVLLLKRKNRMVTREELARTAWNLSDEGEYTDWALDQIMNRLRKKLRLLSVPEKILETHKKKGYRLTLPA